MEAIFIQKIYKLTEVLLRGELEAKKVLPELELHLKKAQSMQLPVYEAEALNTLAIVHYLQNDFSQALAYWEKMLNLSESLSNEKLISKACGNISELLLVQYERHKALEYIERGLKVVESGYQNKLGNLYLHSLEATVYIMLGDFAQAEASAAQFWQIVSAIDLEDYSRFEYGQVIVVMHSQTCFLALVEGNESRFQKHLESLRDLSQQLKLPETATTLQHLLHALIMNKDNQVALEWENKLIEQQGGQLALAEVSKVMELLFYTGNFSKAQAYAQQILLRSEAGTALKQFAESVMQTAG